MLTDCFCNTHRQPGFVSIGILGVSNNLSPILLAYLYLYLQHFWDNIGKISPYISNVSLMFFKQELTLLLTFAMFF